MASEEIPSSVAAPSPPVQLQHLQAWLARLGLSGKLLAIGGLVGFIAVFLPLVSMSMEMHIPGADKLGGKSGINIPAVSSSQSVMVLRDWRGTLCLLGYLAALGLAYVLYAPVSPIALDQKKLTWAGVGVGGFIALMALWLLATALSGSSSMSGFGSSFQISVGIGAIANLLAAAAVATGGILKAREEKLF